MTQTSEPAGAAASATVAEVMLRMVCALFVAACVGLFAGQTLAQSADGPVQTDGQIEVGAEAVRDGEILNRIRNLLAEIDGYN
ncbi:MAG: hypothetical protein ACPGSW_08775, partial [Phaeobacter italicus]